MANLFSVAIAADGVGGYNATPTGVHQAGEVYSIITQFAATGAPIVYISDATATGTNGGQIGKITIFNAGMNQFNFDPPVTFRDGLQVDVSATGVTAGTIDIYWTPRGSPYQG